MTKNIFKYLIIVFLGVISLTSAIVASYKTYKLKSDFNNAPIPTPEIIELTEEVSVSTSSPEILTTLPPTPFVEYKTPIPRKTPQYEYEDDN